MAAEIRRQSTNARLSRRCRQRASRRRRSESVSENYRKACLRTDTAGLVGRIGRVISDEYILASWILEITGSQLQDEFRGTHERTGPVIAVPVNVSVIRGKAGTCDRDGWGCRRTRYRSRRRKARDCNRRGRQVEIGRGHELVVNRRRQRVDAAGHTARPTRKNHGRERGIRRSRGRDAGSIAVKQETGIERIGDS